MTIVVFPQVADLFFVHQRGTMNGIYLVLVIIGNYLGPVASGYIAVSQSWRWSFWYCTIFMAIITLAMIFFLEETKYTPPAIQGRVISTSVEGEDPGLTKVNSVTKEPGVTRAGSISIVDATEAAQNNDRRRLVEIDHSIPMKTYAQRHPLWSLQKADTSAHRSLWMHFFQPFHILISFPAVAFTALQYGFLIAMLAILAVTQATLYPFEPYFFSPIGVGNMNLPPAIGAILGSLFGGPLNDYFILWVAKRRGGIYEPETRLWLFLIPAACMPIGLFMYGLTISKVSSPLLWFWFLGFCLLPLLSPFPPSFRRKMITGLDLLIRNEHQGHGMADQRRRSRIHRRRHRRLRRHLLDILSGLLSICESFPLPPFPLIRPPELNSNAPLTDPRRRTHGGRICAQHHLHRAGIRHHTLDERHGRLRHVCAPGLPEHRRRTDLRSADHLGPHVESQIGGPV